MSLSALDTVILAGGLGTRLASVLADRPKALATVTGRSFLDVLLDRLAAQGLSRIVLALGHRADQIVAHLQQRDTGPATIPVIETTPLGTGGALRNTLPALRSDPILVMNGDSVVEADLAAFYRWHCARAAPMSLLLVQQPDTSRFGRVDIDDAGHVTAFREKTAGQGPGLINAGIYLISRAVIDAMPPNTVLSLERDIFPAWIGQGLAGFATTGQFIDIGTPESLAGADDFFAGLPG